jgi:isocitrate lyase
METEEEEAAEEEKEEEEVVVEEISAEEKTAPAAKEARSASLSVRVGSQKCVTHTLATAPHANSIRMKT